MNPPGGLCHLSGRDTAASLITPYEIQHDECSQSYESGPDQCCIRIIQPMPQRPAAGLRTNRVAQVERDLDACTPKQFSTRSMF